MKLWDQIRFNELFDQYPKSLFFILKKVSCMFNSVHKIFFEYKDVKFFINGE